MSWIFTFLMVSFEIQKFVILTKSKVSLFSFITCGFGVISKKSLSNPRSLRFTPVFSLKSFVVLALTFRFIMYFELIFVFDVI